mmetsp:Transcript_74282/g.123988  ORF Transcript_74282/g.123988 Transcript_74282/m.123988 type:complete len:255 (+) Transcript_74282:46-810(+)|eukprot:CAMPEP_0119330938 /NCGR_PEP_ID=MMETSP1333-20130426/79362_1 /TAXON_ID=418940 /ORGANISM="Scyphosphaera apsteinii, Strain RCC1455" /LENGTH=254 /DNA_ID=CAMNT_0007340417 /DNA_START=44 /DNA_END=808 /DNA_ORIENTATION=+
MNRFLAGSPQIGSLARQAYELDGFIVVDGLFEPLVMADWKRRITEHINKWPQQSRDPSTGRLIEASKTGVTVWMARGNPACPPDFIDELCGPEVSNVLGAIVGNSLQFLSTKPVLKTGIISYASPWHQDDQYWKGSTKHSIWIAIDDAEVSNGCLRVVPGTHLRSFEHQQVHASEGFDYRLDGESFEAEALSVPLKAGSAIFFHDRLVHASHANTNGCDRFCMIPTYRSAEEPDDSPIWPDGAHHFSALSERGI